MLNNLFITNLHIKSVNKNLPFKQLVTLKNSKAADFWLKYYFILNQLYNFNNIVTDLLINNIR
jgi:hypothetical protein